MQGEERKKILTTRVIPKFSEDAHEVLCKRSLPIRKSLKYLGVNIACSHCNSVHESPEYMLERISFGDDDYHNFVVGLLEKYSSDTHFQSWMGEMLDWAELFYDDEVHSESNSCQIYN